MANLFQPSIMRATDNNGNPLNGAKLYFYLTGTTTNALYYLDAEEDTPGPHPLVSNDSGAFAAAYVMPEITYRIKCTDEDGSLTLFDLDPVAGYDAAMVVTSALEAIAAAAEAAASAASAAADAVQTAADRVQTGEDRVAAEAAAGSALTATATAGVYPITAATNVPRGLTQASVGAITAGSSGTNGTFALGWSAGNFSVNPTGTFTVSGGALTAVTITGPGLYIGASPTVPTPSFAASAGLTGAAVALTAQFLVTSGQGYWVQASDGVSLLRYYNSSGTATADTGVEDVPTTNTPGILYNSSIVSANDVEIWTDLNGYIGARTTTRGRITAQPDTIVPLRWLGNSSTLALTLHHILGYGQSLWTGWNSKPVITTAGMFDDALMFNGGVNTAETSENPAVSMTSLIAYFEQNQGANSGETPASGVVGRVTQVFRDRHGKSLREAGIKLLCSTGAKDGAAIASLQKGSTYYTRLINQVTQAKARAAAATPAMDYPGPVIFFDQGQFNSATSIATYLGTFTTTGTLGAAGLYNLHYDLETDLRVVLGNPSFKLKFIMTLPWWNTGLAAPSSHPGSTVAQVKAHQDNPDKFLIANPVYQQNTIDGTHWPAFEGSLAGALQADVWLDEMVYQGRGVCLEPLVSEIAVAGAVVTIPFNVPGGQLVFDTNQAAKATYYGFLCTDNTGAALTHVGDPVIVGTNKVQITLSTPPTSLRVKYADLSTEVTSFNYVGTFRRIFGARGNLRDNTGDLPLGVYRHPALYRARMDRWCIPFDQVVIP